MMYSFLIFLPSLLAPSAGRAPKLSEADENTAEEADSVGAGEGPSPK